MKKSTSILIPVYNGEKYIARAIESALDLYEIAKIIVLDNSSTDRTKEIALSYKGVEYSFTDSLIPMFDNFNRALDLVDTEYFTFLCVDDVLVGQGIRDAITILDTSQDIGIIFGKNIGIDLDSPYVFPLHKWKTPVTGSNAISSWFKASYLYGINIFPYPSGVVFRKKPISMLKFDPKIGAPADISFYFDALLNAEPKFIPNVCAMISIRSDQASAVFKSTEEFLVSQDLLQKKYLRYLDKKTLLLVKHFNAASHIVNNCIRRKNYTSFFCYELLDYVAFVIKFCLLPCKMYFRLKGIIIYNDLYSRKRS